MDHELAAILAEIDRLRARVAAIVERDDQLLRGLLAECERLKHAPSGTHYPHQRGMIREGALYSVSAEVPDELPEQKAC